jgi:hypothetical protein
MFDVAIQTREDIGQAMERNMVEHMSYAAQRLSETTVLTVPA